MLNGLRLLYFLVLFPPACLAGGEPFPIGARSWGLGNASVTLTDKWSVFNNVGGLSGVKQRSVMSSFSSYYNVPGLQVLALGAVYPLRHLHVGLSIQRFGDELYNEHLVGVALGHRIGNVSLGAKINYVQIAVRDLGSRSTVTLELGGVVQLLPELSFGVHLYNPTQARLADYQDERVPTTMKAGLSYRPSKTLLLTAEVEKDVDFPAAFKVGVEYEIVKKLYLRTGISSKPLVNHFGVGWLVKNLTVDYALSTHPQLGFSHHLSLAYQFEKKEKEKGK